MKKFLKTLALFVIAFFVLETFFRAFVVNPSTINSWGYNSDGQGDLLPNKNFLTDEVLSLPYRVITNSQGLRGDKDYAIPKPAGKFRVLAIGDSLTFGPYVGQQDTFPVRLEENLKSATMDAEVINAGIAGYTLSDELEYLQEKGIHLQSDLVILEIYQNDVSDYAPALRAIFSRHSHQLSSGPISTIYGLAKNSAILTAMEKVLANIRIQQVRQQNPTGPGTDSPEELYSSYFKSLLQVENFVNVNNLPVVFVLFPSFNQINSDIYLPQDRIKQKLADKYPVIDLLPVFRQQANPEALYLLPANSHLSAYGNFVVAKTIANQIIQNKVK